MKKRIMMLLLCVIAAAVLGFLHYRGRGVFSGDLVKDPDRYTLRFDEMNREDSHSLTLNGGDTLSVDFSIERGHADLVIGEPGEEPVYRGNDIKDGLFDLTIPRTGTYQITVSGKHAKGSIEVYARLKDETTR